MMQKRHGWWKVAALAAICAVPGLVAGCNGGNGGIIGGGKTQTGAFTGTGTLGAGRAGTFSLKTFSDNTVTGSVNVTAPPAVTKKGTATLPVVVLPTGLYNFTGTVNGSTFTGTGTIPGTSSTFNINGTLSTSTTAGSFTLAGTFNGETFSFTGTITTTTTGGGGGGGGGAANFSFSGNSSNANTAAFSSIAGAGTSLQLPGQGVFLLSGSFASATSATNLRTITVTLVKTSFSVGDTFNLTDEDTPGAGTASVIYTEGAPATKAWISHSGQIKITAKDGNNLTLQVTQAHMEPSDLAGPGQTNQATGEFDLSGSGKLTATGLGL